MMSDEPYVRVVVAQLGARQHYVIPAMCEGAGMLERLHTDFWRPKPGIFARAVARLPLRAARRLNSRSTAHLPDSKVTAHTIEAAYWRFQLERSRDRSEQYEVHRRWGERFARRVADRLEASDFTTFFGFSSAALEALETARRMGALAIVDEIAPTHLEDRIIAEEQERFPGWEPAHAPTPPAFLDRLKAEWTVADRILVNSEWSRQALLNEGAKPEKIAVVPISYVADRVPLNPKTRSKYEPLKVLWLGTLNLRKGFPYAIEAARRLLGQPVEFTFVGPSTINLGTVDWPDNATYLGQVPRPEIPELWDDHHLYLLPTLSDGFAITQIEAQAHGLPIVVTPNCADVVVDGRSGLRVPPRDPGAIVDAILSFLDGENDLTAASIAAIQRSKAFSHQAVWPQLLAVLTPDPCIVQGGASR